MLADGAHRPATPRREVKSLIACVDGLTGFPDAIEAVFPQAWVPTCILHQHPLLTQPGALEQFTGALEWAFETAAAPTQP